MAGKTFQGYLLGFRTNTQQILHMKNYIFSLAMFLYSCVVSTMVTSCGDGDDLEIYCITGVNQEGDRVTLNCAVKDRVDATIERYPDYTDYQSRLVGSCGDCPL